MFNEIFGRKANGLEFTFKPTPSAERNDEILRHILLNMGCDKDDLKDIIEFIEYKKYKKEMGILGSSVGSSKADLILNNGKHSDEFNQIKNLPVK